MRLILMAWIKKELPRRLPAVPRVGPVGPAAPGTGTVRLVFAIFLAAAGVASATATLPAGPAAGNVYYVAPHGDDANPGTEGLPWRTVGKAAATLAAGDTVLIGAGTYAEMLVPAHSGSSGAPITFASRPGHRVTLDGSSLVIPEWDGLVNLVNLSWINIVGLEVANARSNPHNPGILADTCTDILVSGNRVFGANDSGIAIWSSQNVTVTGNHVHDVCLSGFNECISVGGSAGFLVEANHVHDSGKEGICVKDGSCCGTVRGNRVHHTGAVCYYVDAQDKHTHDIDVVGNVASDGVEDGFELASEVGGLLENIRVFNNIGYRNGWVGLQVSACCVDAHPLANIEIVNNTFVGNGLPPWGGGILLENAQATGVVIRNNLLSGNLSFQLAVSPEVPADHYVADHNLIDGFVGDEGEIRGNFWVEGAPGFLLAASGDFHVLAASPARGAGSPVSAPTLDLDGEPRPPGTNPDIGAYQALPVRPAVGDLDGDGRVTARDLLSLALLVSGELGPALPPCRFPSAGDLDGGGTLTPDDPPALARRLAMN